jgi:hypothetical protein
MKKKRGDDVQHTSDPKAVKRLKGFDGYRYSDAARARRQYDEEGYIAPRDLCEDKTAWWKASR